MTSHRWNLTAGLFCAVSAVFVLNFPERGWSQETGIGLEKLCLVEVEKPCHSLFWEYEPCELTVIDNRNNTATLTCSHWTFPNQLNFTTVEVRLRPPGKQWFEKVGQVPCGKIYECVPTVIDRSTGMTVCAMGKVVDVFKVDEFATEGDNCQ